MTQSIETEAAISRPASPASCNMNNATDLNLSQEDSAIHSPKGKETGFLAASKPGDVCLASAAHGPALTDAGNAGHVFIIGIAGGSASGKTSVSEMIIRRLNVPSVVLISMDSFYKALGPEAIAKASKNDYNFDHPDAFDYPLLYRALRELKLGHSVEIPIYDFTTHSRRPETMHINGASVVIFEGILSFFDQDVISLMDLKIFVDTDADVRLSRRLIRDIAERGRDLKGILEQYNRFVKPSFDDFIQPTVRHADIIIPRGSENLVAIDLITKHIARRLEEQEQQQQQQQ